MRRINKIDYAGFTFNGIHTSQLGLYSVSNGDRYSRDLSPSWNLKTSTDGGRHGTTYFGYQYTQKTINMTLATDSMTEEEYRITMQWLNSDISPLVFDERPYLQYYARVSTTPTFAFIAFDEDGEGTRYTTGHLDVATEPLTSARAGKGRIYKGDITFSFVIYEPYGFSVKKYLDEYEDANKDEWAVASHLRSTKGDLDTATTGTGGATQFKVYNGGDVEADFILTFEKSVELSAQSPSLSLSLEGSSKMLMIDTSKLYLDSLGYTSISKYLFKIDTKKRLLSCSITGNNNASETITKTIIGNNAITKGDLFKIPVSITTDQTFLLKFDSEVEGASIDYKYKYL